MPPTRRWLTDGSWLAARCRRWVVERWTTTAGGPGSAEAEKRLRALFASMRPTPCCCAMRRGQVLACNGAAGQPVCRGAAAAGRHSLTQPTASSCPAPGGSRRASRAQRRGHGAAAPRPRAPGGNAHRAACRRRRRRALAGAPCATSPTAAQTQERLTFTGQLRQPHRPAQPRAVPRPPGAGDGARAAQRPPDGADVPGPRPLQGRQRQPRPRGRRPPAAACGRRCCTRCLRDVDSVARVASTTSRSRCRAWAATSSPSSPKTSAAPRTRR